MSHVRSITTLIFTMLFSVSFASAQEVLKVEQAKMLVGGKDAPLNVQKDSFGPGRHAVSVNGPGGATFTGGPVRSQIRFTCTDVPEGDYHIGVWARSSNLTGFTENFGWQLWLYHNDTRLGWTGVSEPTRPQNTASKDYQAQMQHNKPVHIKPGDVVRLVVSNLNVGDVVLSKTPFTDTAVTFKDFIPQKMENEWLNAGWDDAACKRDGDTITQTCWLYNPGVLERTFSLDVRAVDYLQRPLLTVPDKTEAIPGGYRETISLKAGQRVMRTFTYTINETGYARLDLKASAPDVYPAILLVKYVVDDVKSGARPRAKLNGDWDVCWLPQTAVEPGDAPPSNAQWKPMPMPQLLENKLGHCAWLRRTFQSPDYIKGERIVLAFNQCMSEAWIYVNGKLVHHQPDGTQPFEADVTEVWKQGKDNQLLVAVRDWISCSKKNRQRIKTGEEAVFKDGMDAPAGYTALGDGAGCMGIGKPAWVEARPAVAVRDVGITTSLRDKKLRLDYAIRNDGASAVRVAIKPLIWDAGKVVSELAPVNVELKAGAVTCQTITAPWPKGVKMWQPGEPHLYVLQTALGSPAKPTTDALPGPIDTHLRRFGFRDIWIDGIHFIVNGQRMKIRSCWASGATGMHGLEGPDYGKRLEGCWLVQMNNMINGEVQLSRTHNMVGVRELCEVADETGLMLKVENGSFCQEGFTFDKAFWEASALSETRMVDLYRSHPSVFMWSAGNENMWGWAYQGEATRTMGNHHQVKLVQAMREHDPQARPIEFEADGDLMGRWEYHQLHYPRELSGFPAVPVSTWWGPLDGKTVVPYSMGDITLGQKPITDGEAFWPATHSHPFGQTILLGDKPYITSSYWGWGWNEASSYFTNGFRDVEFALIDIYNSMALIKPQTIILKEETARFFGGRTIERNLNIHNDVPRSTRLKLQWTLSGDGNKGLDHGSRTLRMDAAELKRLTLKVDLPKVARATKAAFVAELIEEGKVIHTEAREWTIYPAPKFTAPANLKLSVYDPEGDTARLLTSIGVNFEKMDVLSAPKAGAMILGKNALKSASGGQGPWRDQLLAFVRGGGKVLVMEQGETPDFLPFPMSLAPKSESTIAFVRAGDHPILRGLSDDAMRWWADDHYVARGNYRKPISGNFLPLVDIGTMEGTVETPLAEEYLGKGSIVLCQLQVTGKALTAPAAATMLQNILDYLASPAAFRTPGKTALVAGTNESLRKSLDGAKLVYENLTGRVGDLKFPAFAAAIVDADALDDATIAAVKSFVDEGGNVLLGQATPKNQAKVEAILGFKLHLLEVAKEGNDVLNHVARRTLTAGTGILSGVSNHDLYWASGAYLADIRHEGGWWSGSGKITPDEYIAEYFAEPVGETAQGNEVTTGDSLTRPGTLVQVRRAVASKVGSAEELTRADLEKTNRKGMIILSQLRLDRPVEACQQTAGRLRSLLLTNLGCTFEGQGVGGVSRADRMRKYVFETVDLSRWANRGLKDDKAAGIVGWSNQGDIDMRNMPTGKQTFADVPFFIAAPKGVCVLQSDGGVNKDLPREIKGIAINRKADAVFFMHSMAYAGGDGRKYWKYRVNYTDGTNVDVPIVGGVHVIDWWDDPARFGDAMAAAGVVVGFKGDNPIRKNVIVLQYEWVNPSPQKEIATIDFARMDDKMSDGVPMLAGITTATLTSDQGVVEDIIGTEGVKVRLGTTLVDVYYIGVKGIAKEHAYNADALAAHKAMVVGKKVLVIDDVVAKNQAGQRLAYVYLADPNGPTPPNMLNARMIGDGLGKLGNFEGNNRHRMYLENLGFIANQGKKGLWAKEK